MYILTCIITRIYRVKPDDEIKQTHVDFPRVSCGLLTFVPNAGFYLFEFSTSCCVASIFQVTMFMSQNEVYRKNLPNVA